MNLKRMLIFIQILLTAFAVSYAAETEPTEPQPPSGKCSSDEYRQFDFWIGHWDLSWGKGETAGTGTNIITAELDDCVIEENFTSHDAQPFVGHSLSVYNPTDQLWRQTWVDNNGGYLDFEGGPDGDRMILSREANKDGKTFLQRMVWYNIEDDSLDWNWERSVDSGVTWEVLWKIHYRRSSPMESHEAN